MAYKSITPHVEDLLTPTDQKQVRQKKNQTPSLYQQQKNHAQFAIQRLGNHVPMSLQPVFVSHSHQLNASQIVESADDSPGSRGKQSPRQTFNVSSLVGPKKSTIEHKTAYMDDNDTHDMLKVKTLGPLIDKNAHMKEMRGNLDKV